MLNLEAQPARSSRYEYWRWRVLFATWLAYVGFYLVRRSFSVAKIELVKPESLGWSKAEIATIDGSYSIAYAVGNFVFGALGDRFGPRSVVTMGLLASALIAFASGVSTTVAVMGLLLGLQGLCQSAGWAPLAKNVGEFFSLRERGRAIGIWCTSMPAGSFAGSALAGAALVAFGWRYAFWAPAVAVVAVAVVFFLLDRNRPEDVGLPSIESYHGEPESAPSTGSVRDSMSSVWREVLLSPIVWLLAISYLLLKPTRYLIMAWAPLYINERLGTNEFDSSVLGSVSELAGLISPFVGGWLSDRWFGARRMPLSIVALFACAGLWFCFGRLPLTAWSLGLGLFAIGFLIYIPETLLSGSAAVDFGTKRGAATASGFINGAGSLGAVVGMTIPGWLERLLGPGVDLWNTIFGVLAVGLVVAGAMLIPQWNRLPFRRQ